MDRINKLARFIFLENFYVIICLLVLAVAGALAYRNAFSGPFMFDDLKQVLQNPSIQSWQWPWAFLENNRRPVLYATLAWNFHSHGFNSFAFHEFNIRVHVLAAMMLFLLVRKTLLLPSSNGDLRRNANVLALASAVLWLLHPVHTQAVTYIIQRAESLMGLFFLTTMFFSSQYFAAKKPVWFIAAGVTSLLAGLTKEVALVLPLMVLFYDRTFISSDFRTALKNHRPLYIALSLTWAVMIYLYLTTSPEQVLTAGFGMKGMSPLLYLINQPAVVLHYVRLAVWPNSLVFDYQWPPVEQLRDLWPTIVVLVSWIALAIAAYRTYRTASFLLLSFLLVLLPSSSVIPLKDLIFEYRLYLSLSCAAVGFVLVLHYLTQRAVSSRTRSAFFIACVAIAALVLGGLTYQRNKMYASEELVWVDVIKKQPLNARAYNNLGEYLMRQERDADAKICFLQAMALNNTYPDVYANLSTVAGRAGKPQEALEYAKKAIAMTPGFAIAQNNAGSALSQLGRYEEAVPYFEKTIALGFTPEGVVQNLAMALSNAGHAEKAVKVLKEELQRHPESKAIRALLERMSYEMNSTRP